MITNKKRVRRGGELILNLHPSEHLSECIDEKTAKKIQCMSETVYAVFDSEASNEERLNLVKCAITSAFMLGKDDAYKNLMN